MDVNATREFVERVWDESILPELVEYIRIPCKSPHFDPAWEQHGHIERAVEQISGWCRKRAIEGLELEVVRLEGRTPLLYVEIPGEGRGTVLLYGHLDKQPEMSGWSEGLGPWTPVMRGDRLYGRGGADDGYSAFASLTAIEALRRQGVPHARCVVLIEACEESGSYDLPYYIDALAGRIGEPGLVICLDSGCGNYEQLWHTSSLRGLVNGRLSVEILEQGVHSGDASGVVPSSFRVARRVLGRVEDEASGALLPRELYAEIPARRVAEARHAAEVLGRTLHERFPFVPGAGPVTTELAELVLNRTWRPALSVTGAAGLPAPEDAGNVLRPRTVLALSLRLPPTVRAEDAAAAMKRALEDAPPYGASVRFEFDPPSSGWNAPELAPWLSEATDAASRAFFGRKAALMGEGGTIPFMGMLGERFPAAQFLITGVLGPQSNAHGPNEFLHVPTGKRLTACVAHVLAAHRRASA